MTAPFRRLTLISLGVALMQAPAVTAAADASHTEWQLRRLFAPTTREVERESKGRVFIYHRLPDTAVARALDEQFDRVDAMMFTGVIITNSEGKEVRDPDTGDPLVEDDGCD